MPQEPGATIRVDGKLYQELREIAEARDCTLRQAMDFWIDRMAKGVKDADNGAKPKRKAATSRKPASKPKKRASRAKKPVDPCSDEAVNAFFRE